MYLRWNEPQEYDGKPDPYPTATNRDEAMNNALACLQELNNSSHHDSDETTHERRRLAHKHISLAAVKWDISYYSIAKKSGWPRHLVLDFVQSTEVYTESWRIEMKHIERTIMRMKHEAVLYIRSRIQEGQKREDLAKEFGISEPTLRKWMKTYEGSLIDVWARESTQTPEAQE